MLVIARRAFNDDRSRRAQVLIGLGAGLRDCLHQNLHGRVDLLKSLRVGGATVHPIQGSSRTLQDIGGPGAQLWAQGDL